MSVLKNKRIVSIPIANGATESTAFQLGNAKYLALETPATMVGTTVTFEVLSALNGTSWVGLRDTAGNLVTITVSATVAYISGIDGVDLEALLSVCARPEDNIRLKVSAQSGGAIVCAMHVTFEVD